MRAVSHRFSVDTI